MFDQWVLQYGSRFSDVSNGTRPTSRGFNPQSFPRCSLHFAPCTLFSQLHLSTFVSRPYGSTKLSLSPNYKYYLELQTKFGQQFQGSVFLLNHTRIIKIVRYVRETTNSFQFNFCVYKKNSRDFKIFLEIFQDEISSRINRPLPSVNTPTFNKCRAQRQIYINKDLVCIKYCDVNRLSEKRIVWKSSSSQSVLLNYIFELQVTLNSVSGRRDLKRSRQGCFFLSFTNSI